MASSLPDFRPGDPVPWFEARASNNPRFQFSSVAGRYTLLCFFGSAAAEPGRRAVEAVRAARHLFDDTRAAFFGVTFDPSDRDGGRAVQFLPGIRYFWDFDLAVARRFGAVEDAAPGDRTIRYRTFWLLLDPMLRVIRCAPLEEAEAMLRAVAALPVPDLHGGAEVPAPVLVLPRVFEPEFCRELVRLYELHGGRESGFMRDVGGRTIPFLDASHKKRSDLTIEDPAIRDAARRRIERRLIPEIRKAFQFPVTRMERYIVACYDSADGGHFRPHRDNTTKATAHRRFAVSINLNAEEFEGGNLRFPEFGSRTYRPPTGGAVVFSCSLLHEATPVTAGRRYAFLPFLYDEAGARVRTENRRFLADGEPLQVLLPPGKDAAAPAAEDAPA